MALSNAHFRRLRNPGDSITPQVLGAVAKLERPLIAERNAAQRRSLPAAIRSEHLASPTTGIS